MDKNLHDLTHSVAESLGDRVKNVIYDIADDAGLDGNRLMWVEVFVENYKEDPENEQRNIQ